MKLNLIYILLGCFLGSVLLFAFIFSLPDGKLHLYFCDVGQGDGAYIRTPNNMDILIDGGPNNKVLNCLGKYMPFYDRTIDVVMLSHPQKDHLQGLISVVERLKVNNFIIGVEANDTEGYNKLITLLTQKKVKTVNLYSGDKFNLGNVGFSILWPEKIWVVENVSSSSLISSDLESINGSNTLGFQTTQRNINDFSYFLKLQYYDFDALFTGDGDSRIQAQIMATIDLPQVEVLKFPHHGSKYGVLDEFLEKVRPQLAVISVGQNPWGHPTKEALMQLSNQNIKIARTDLSGDIEVISDGKSWWRGKIVKN